jgi:predicted DNA-binding transcriptional regulator AlpA
MPYDVTAKQICRFFKISRRTLHRWVQKGSLPPPIYFGRSPRWKGPIESWFAEVPDDPAPKAQVYKSIETKRAAKDAYLESHPPRPQPVRVVRHPSFDPS